ANLLNYTPPDTPVPAPDVPNQSPEEIQLWAYENLTESQLKQVREHRASECDLRRKYLETTFTELILELTEQVNESQQASLFGDDDAEERQKLEDRISKLRERKKQRLTELELMLRLSANLPDVV